MAISENDGLLNQQEYEAFKERSIRLKFMSQLFGALGGATFFGLLMEVGKQLVTTGALGGIAIAPAIGLSLVGIACVYMAQRFFFESQTLDQDFNAKKIAAATTKAQAMGIEQSRREPARGNQTAIPGMALRDETNAHHESQWTEKVPQRSHTEKHADAVTPKQQTESWAQEVLTEDKRETQRTIH